MAKILANIRSTKELKSAQALLESRIEQREEMIAFKFKMLKTAYSPRNILNNFLDDLSDTYPMVELAIKGYEIASAVIGQLRK